MNKKIIAIFAAVSAAAALVMPAAAKTAPASSDNFNTGYNFAYVNGPTEIPEDSKMTYIYTMNAVSNPDYCFSHDGYTYIMLKESNGTTFLYADDTYGMHKTSGTPTNTFNPTESNPDKDGDLIYWLNTAFLNGGEASESTVVDRSRPIDKAIVKYLVEKEWPVEIGSGGQPSYSFNAKVSLISVSELKEYQDKIGFQPKNQRGTTSNKMMLTRTRPKNAGGCLLYFRMLAGNIQNGNVSLNNYGVYYIRPCFYVNDSFFSEVKLNVHTMGSEVKRKLLGLGYESAAKIYSSEELREIGFEENSPIIEGAAISGNANVGSELSVIYKAFNVGESSVSYLWERSNDEGGYDVISGANESSYVLTEAELGKTVRATVSIGAASAGAVSKTVGEKKSVAAETEAFTVSESGASLSFKIRNSTAFELPVTVILTAFDENGKILGASAKNYNVSYLGESGTLELSAEGTAYAKAAVLAYKTSFSPIYTRQEYAK